MAYEDGGPPVMGVIVFAVLMAGAFLLGVLTGVAASQQSLTLSFGSNTGTFGTGEVLLASEPVPDSLVGASCVVTVSSDNNTSIHPGNTLAVSSGGSAVSVPGFEEDPGAFTATAGVITLAGQVDVTLVYGPNQNVSSAVGVVDLDCTPPTPTTVPPATTGPDTTTTTAPDAVPSTTVAAPDDYYEYQVNCDAGQAWVVVAFRTVNWDPPVRAAIDINGRPAVVDSDITDDDVGILMHPFEGSVWVTPSLDGVFLPGVRVDDDCAKPAVPVPGQPIFTG